jgi:hypothetical protein
MATMQRDRYQALTEQRTRMRLWMEGITPMWVMASQREPVAGVEVSGGSLWVIVTDPGGVEEGQGSQSVREESRMRTHVRKVPNLANEVNEPGLGLCERGSQPGIAARERGMRRQAPAVAA